MSSEILCGSTARGLPAASTTPRSQSRSGLIVRIRTLWKLPVISFRASELKRSAGMPMSACGRIPAPIRPFGIFRASECPLSTQSSRSGWSSSLGCLALIPASSECFGRHVLRAGDDAKKRYLILTLPHLYSQSLFYIGLRSKSNVNRSSFR